MGDKPAKRARVRSTPKGRRVDPKARSGRGALCLARAPRRRDLLIEHLHKIQDRFGCLVGAASGGARGRDEAGDDRGLRSRDLLSPLRRRQGRRGGAAGHHRASLRFDRLRDRRFARAAGEAAGPARPGRARAACAVRRPLRDGPRRRRRTESGPACDDGEGCGARHAKAVAHPRRGDGASHPHLDIVSPGHIDYAAYRAGGGYELAAACIERRKDARGRHRGDGQTPVCAASAARAFPRAASGSWSRPSRRRVCWRSTSTKASRARSRTATISSATRTVFSKARSIAAWAVGIAEIYIYLRDEYHGCRAILETEVAALQANPPCALPPIHLRRGAGAYICGEESAMIESIEGKRGEPRLRPPYVAQVGLFNRPTLEHNMETLHWVRDILQKGPAWFAGHGRRGRKGLRSFSVSGRVNNPGVKLAPAGITVKELIDEYCGGMLGGHTFYCVSAGRCVRRHSAGVDGRHPARFRHVERVRLLHRLGGDRDPVGPRHRGRARPAIS